MVNQDTQVKRFQGCLYLLIQQRPVQTGERLCPLQVEVSQNAAVSGQRRSDKHTHTASHRRAAGPRELIQRSAGKTGLYLPLAETRLQTTQRFISVTSPLSYTRAI